MPTKLFIPNTVAYASDVMTYLMNQVIAQFEDPTERDAAWGDGTSVAEGGDGKPELQPGQFCYLSDKNGDGSNVAEVQYWDGDSWVGASSFTLPDQYVTNIKVSDNADIEISKLEPGTSAQLIVCDNTGTPTYVTLSGDATISNTGVLTVNGSAAITLGSETIGSYVERITGTTNQIAVAGSGSESASVTLSLPQDIHTGASPTFTSLNISGTASVATHLTVSGSAAISGAASVATNLTVSGSTAVTGAMTVGGTVTVTGNVVSHAVPETAASLTNAIDGKIVEVSASTVALTTTGGSWTDGTQFTVISTNASGTTVTAGTGTTFRAAPLNGSNVKLRTQYSSATFIYKSSGAYWYVIGDLSST